MPYDPKVTLYPPGAAWGTDYYRPTAAGRQSSHYQPVSPSCPVEKLARAKILVMFEDLLGRGRHDYAQARHKHRMAAHRWFFSSGSDFEDWCITAGLCPDSVRERARRVYELEPPEPTKGRGGRNAAWKGK
jgi:hypothetical protein